MTVIPNNHYFSKLFLSIFALLPSLLFPELKVHLFEFQVLFTIPSFIDTYVTRSNDIFDSISFDEDQTKNCLLQVRFG